MKLQPRLKVSLDELRMQMLGVQVLFGFQFQGLFQDNFAALPAAGPRVDAAGLGLMVVALGLMIAVPCQHRIVDNGDTTSRIYTAAAWYAQLALLPLAAGVGCDVFVAASGPFGSVLGSVLSVVTFAAALLGWYALGIGLRKRWRQNDPEAPMQHEKTPLHAKIEQMLTEARVVLPGAQALLGFQLIVMLTRAFGQLPPAVKYVHLLALISLTLAVILLICPAAIHRIAFGGTDDPRMHSAGSLLITLALLPLAVAISCDLWVALTILFGEGLAALVGAVAAFALLTVLWFLLPFFLRRRVSPTAVAMRH